MARILLVDDETVLLESIARHLRNARHDWGAAETIAGATEELRGSEPDLAILDIRLPDGNGVDLVRSIRQEGQAFPIILLTAFGSIPNAVNAIRAGATEYIEKPVDLEQLTLVVERNLETARLKERVELYERTRPDQAAATELIGESPRFREALDLAQTAARPGVDVAAEMPTALLTGETGTGKDLFARFIHHAGPLRDQPLVHVDCAALPRELIESELFGHERGAFTDAKTNKRGLLEIAGGGTVFLNEIGELPVALQAKLLTALENRSFRRVGGTRHLTLKARIIAATNADLLRRVEEKTFRRDLFYRLNVFNIELPPLRERGDDGLLLAEHFVNRLCRKYHKPEATMTPAARALLRGYHWPGNVRELLHVLERASLIQENAAIGPEHLGIHAAQPPPAGDGAPVGSSLLDMTLPEMERRMVEEALQRANGNVSKAARMLGISRGALRRRLESTP